VARAAREFDKGSAQAAAVAAVCAGTDPDDLARRSAIQVAAASSSLSSSFFVAGVIVGLAVAARGDGSSFPNARDIWGGYNRGSAPFGHSLAAGALHAKPCG
jgi:hypothetical protein